MIAAAVAVGAVVVILAARLVSGRVTDRAEAHPPQPAPQWPSQPPPRTDPQRTVITVCVVLITVVVLGAAGLWLLSAIKQAQSPEEKCRQVMAQLEKERGTIDAGIWLSVYNDCVARERAK